jgi:hypothetical protein
MGILPEDLLFAAGKQNANCVERLVEARTIGLKMCRAYGAKTEGERRSKCAMCS